ncbi:Uncharacterized protein Adt_06511 [Abeliophyllum distichum]|uniref:Transposase n=1 Tax=Abeliophyllum distichum TaxID=126358 RepID=A0ABD1V740_9LAMI
MPVTRGGYKSGQVSQEKSTRGGGKRSTRNDYGSSEANILNDELEDELIADAFHSEDMYRSNNRGRGHRSGRASQQRSTQNVGRGSEHDNYRETNISNHEVEDEHIDDELYPEDVFRPNKRAMCDRNSPTRGGYTFGRASQWRSTKGGGTRSIRENDGHQEPNTLNDELEDEHIDDMTKSSNKTRGPNRGTPMPDDRSQRIQISIEGDTFVETFIPRDITATITAYFDGPYPTFRSMPQPIRDGLWDRFLDKYVWPTANTANVYEAWKKTTKDRYKDMMNDARNQAKCKSQSDNPVDWRGHGPPWIRAEHWDSLLNYWNTDKWKNNAKIAKENRITQGQDGEMKKHIAGSVSFVTTKKRLDKYKASIDFKYSTDRDNQPEFDPDAWINAVNGPSKGRIYGFGP